MSPAALLVLAALVWFVQTSARRNPRRRRRPSAGQLGLPETPAAYPVFSVAGGGKLPNRKKQPFWVFAQWAGVSSNDLRWFSHDPVGRGFSSYAEAADVARELARDQGGVFEPSREARHRLLARNPRRRADRCYVCQRSIGSNEARWLVPGDRRRALCTNCADEMAGRHGGVPASIRRIPPPSERNPRRCCRCGSGYPCLPNPYTAACRFGPGHVYDFRGGGRCQCCGRAAPKRLVTLEWDAGGQTDYGRTCAGRAIGTTKLRTNQLAHMEREATETAARQRMYRGVARAPMAESGIVRPPYAWARGLSLSALAKIARDAGVSPYQDAWWDTANLVQGGREMHYIGGVGVERKRRRSGEYVGAVLEGGHQRDRRRAGRSTAGETVRGRARVEKFTGYKDLPF